jgi:hypothetical protein
MKATEGARTGLKGDEHHGDARVGVEPLDRLHAVVLRHRAVQPHEGHIVFLYMFLLRACVRACVRAPL